MEYFSKCNFSKLSRRPSPKSLWGGSKPTQFPNLFSNTEPSFPFRSKVPERRWVCFDPAGLLASSTSSGICCLFFRITGPFVCEQCVGAGVPVNCPYIDIPTHDVRRWMLALRHLSNPWVKPLGIDKLSFVVDRVSNWPPFRGFQKDWSLLVGFSLTGLIYGALHCAAWNAPFPSNLEALLWRVSSVAVSATAISMFLLFLWELSPPLNDFPMGYSKPGSGRPNYLPVPFLQLLQSIVATGVLFVGRFIVRTIAWVSRILFDIFVLGCVILYLLARVFLVVECFIHLTHLPDSAFQIPKWTQYLPAIS